MVRPINYVLFSIFQIGIVQIIAIDFNQKLNRTQRAVQFPQSSTIGIFAAIAVPISKEMKNVFVSYNFEANYNSPATSTDFTRPLEKYAIPESRKSRSQLSISQRTSGLTRRKAYHILETKFEAYGFSGRSCLLRTICEAAETPLGMMNGVLGDIIHVILTPSTSIYEYLPEIYYEAEIIGTMARCDVFHWSCPRSVLDFISILDH